MTDADGAKPQPEERNKGKWRSESLTFALLPIVAYLLTFAYQTAYFGFFGVPESAVALDFASLLELSSLLTAVFILIAAFLFWTHPLWLIACLALGVAVGVVFVTYQMHQPLLFGSGILTFFGIVWLVWVWGRWYPRFRKNPEIGPPYEGISYSPFKSGTLAVAVKASGVGAGTVIAILFLVFVYSLADSMAGYLGAHNAAYTHWFLVNAKRPTEFIVGRSGDRWVCGELDSSSTIITSYSFHSIGTDSTTWQWRRLPALHPAHKPSEQ